MKYSPLSLSRAMFVRVLAVLVLTAPPVAVNTIDLFAQGNEAGREAVRESLGESEWYDSQRDDYRRYAPEDIELPEESDGPRCNRAPNMAPTSGLSPVILNFLAYGLIAGLCALILYLIARIVMERRNEERISLEDLEAAEVVHEELPDEIAGQAGIDLASKEPLNLKRLRDMIEGALRDGELGRACVYMFLFALLGFHHLGHLELHRDRTAREYVRSLQGGGPAGGLVDLFADLARLFEYALYRGHLPETVDSTDVRDRWSRLRAAIDGEAAAPR